MTSKRLVLAVCCLALCLGLLVWVVPAQARFLEPAPAAYPQQNMQVNTPSNHAGVCAPGSTGDGNQIKVFTPTIQQNVVFLQCGHVVGKTFTAGCGCGGSGDWRYTTDCPHNPTIYVNLPCPRKIH